MVRVRGVLSRIAGQRQKVGHLGTLDPLATGVLPIAVGTATRLFDHMLKKEKRYIATFRFGVTTDTLDAAGVFTLMDENAASLSEKLTENAIRRAADALTGEIMQMPPQYSAKSVGGKRAYDIARMGGVAELESKRVVIHSLEPISEDKWRILSSGYLGDKNSLDSEEYAFDITCSSGTYIRAIARDMAQKLGTVGYMTSLIRVQSGCFGIEDAVSFERFERDPMRFLLPINVYTDGLIRYDLPENRTAAALNGIRIECDLPSDIPIAVYGGNEVVAIGECVGGKLVLMTRL